MIQVIHKYPHYDNPDERDKKLQECYNNTQRNIARIKRNKEDAYECNLCEAKSRQEG